ncbi:MAG: radical SAM protein [Elusimicrobiota bacterium]
MISEKPSYLGLSERGFLEKIKALESLLRNCLLCPRRCQVNRLKDQLGICRTGKEIKVSSHNLHFGEEPPISGARGSGAIFFAYCSLRCVFCQNYPISQFGHGNPVTIEELGSMMLSLQQQGAQNINLVTPTHLLWQIVQALYWASRRGLALPIVYNSGGYESVETLALLEGLIDIYLPDAKYSAEEQAIKYSSAPNYWEVNKPALKEMYRQVGNLTINEEGAALRGLLVRHLVLPEGISGSEKVLKFLAEEISPDLSVSLMAQYHPAHQANSYPELSRRLSAGEYQKVLDLADSLGLKNGWRQEL